MTSTWTYNMWLTASGAVISFLKYIQGNLFLFLSHIKSLPYFQNLFSSLLLSLSLSVSLEEQAWYICYNGLINQSFLTNIKRRKKGQLSLSLDLSKMGKKEHKDHHSTTLENDDKVEAVLHLLRKHSPLTLKQVGWFTFINQLTNYIYFLLLLTYFGKNCMNIAGEVL